MRDQDSIRRSAHRPLPCGFAPALLATVLALLLLGGCHAAAPATIVYRTDHEPTIDGLLDEPCWKAATPVEVNFRFDATGVRDTRQHMIARLTWDEHYLYIAYEVFDANLVAVPRGDKPKGPPGKERPAPLAWGIEQKVDVAEFILSFNDPMIAWEIQQNANNAFTEIWDVVPSADSPSRFSSMKPFWARHFLAWDEYIHDDGPYTVATAVHLKPKGDGKPSTPNDPTDTDTGYTAEIRLPWRGLGAPVTWRVHNPSPKVEPDEAPHPMAFELDGRTIRVLAAVLDGDFNPPYFHSCPGLSPRALFAPNYEHWPVYRFSRQTH